jgi:hypothetical protein
MSGGRLFLQMTRMRRRMKTKMRRTSLKTTMRRMSLRRRISLREKQR